MFPGGSVFSYISVDRGPDTKARHIHVVDERPAEVPDPEERLPHVVVDEARHDEAGDHEHQVAAPARQHIPGQAVASREVLSLLGHRGHARVLIRDRSAGLGRSP